VQHAGKPSWRAVAALVFGSASLAFGSDPAAPISMLKKLSFEELLDVEVMSVSRRMEKLADAASAIQVVTGDEIRRSGASGIPEALRLANNLQAAQKTSHGWGISARGFNTELANKLLVMIDGRTVYTPLFSGVFWNAQDYLLEDLDRIEVISGPGGTLWGANAVNGVINIISRKASETQGLYLEGGAGSFLENFAGARYGGKLAPGISYRVYGRHFERDNLVYEDGRPVSDSWTMTQGGFRLDAETRPDQTLTFQGDLYSGRAWVSAGGVGDFNGGNLLGRWSRTLSRDSEVTLQLYYDRTYLYNPITNQFGPTSILIDELDTYDLDFQHSFRANDRHRIVWGAGYRFTHNVVQSAQTLAFLPERLNHELFSGFVQDEITLGEKLFFTVGSKVEHNDYTGTEFEPSVRLQWIFAPEKSLWSAVSRAVRTPSRIDRDAFQPRPPPAVLVGNSRFDSETVIAYEVGYRSSMGERGSFSISGFYNDYNRLRSLSFTPVTIVPLFFENNVEGETYGLELTTAHRLLDWWRVRLGYNLLKEHLQVSPGKIDVGNALNETSDPEHQASFRSSMDLRPNLELDLGLRWIGKLRNNNLGTVGIVPAYWELDARLAWRPTEHLELSVVGQNLLHARHVEFGTPDATRQSVKRGVVGKATWRY
jgi:iron complex outermembrane recepter protein